MLDMEKSAGGQAGAWADDAQGRGQQAAAQQELTGLCLTICASRDLPAGKCRSSKIGKSEGGSECMTS